MKEEKKNLSMEELDEVAGGVVLQKTNAALTKDPMRAALSGKKQVQTSPAQRPEFASLQDANKFAKKMGRTPFASLEEANEAFLEGLKSQGLT